MARQPAPVDYTSATIAGTAGTILGLADSGFPTTLPVAAKCFVGRVETAPIRARGDGTAPTTTEGELYHPGDPVLLSETEIGGKQFIRTTSTSGIIKGHFYNVELDVLVGMAHSALARDARGSLISVPWSESQALADALSNTMSVPEDYLAAILRYPVVPYLFNGTTWDRKRGIIEGTLLASAARTATTYSPDQTNYNDGKGVLVWLNVTAVPGTDTVKLQILAKDPVSGAYSVLLDGGTTATAVMKTGLVYPGVAAAAADINNVAGFLITRTWRAKVVHSAGSSFTYSVGYCVL